MKTRTPSKYHPRDLYLAEVGLTVAQIEVLTRHADRIQINLVCTEHACHVAISEFELIRTIDQINSNN